MESPQDNRPKFEEMSGFQEIKFENEVEEDFVEKAEKYIIGILDIMLDLTKTFFLPLTVRLAIIYLILDLLFNGVDAMYSVTRIVFLVVLLVYEGR